MSDTSAATSPAVAAPAAKTSDAKGTGSGNLTVAAASAQMFARQVEAAKKSSTTAPATAETAPGNTETTTAPVAEAPAASVESLPETTATADATGQVASSTPAEAEIDGGEDDVLSPKSSLDPRIQERINKRIGKEVAKRGVLEAQMKERDARIAALQAERDAALNRVDTTQPAPQAPARQTAPPANQPLAEITDPSALADLRRQAREAIRFVEDTLETPRAWKDRTIQDPESGEEIKVRTTKLGDQELTEDQLRAVRRQAKLTLEDHIPAREQYLAARAQTQQLAHQRLPFLKDKQSPEYQQVQQFLRNPWAQQNPHAEWIAGVYVKGLKALEAEETAAKSAAEPATKPKVAAIKTTTDQTAPAATGSAGRVPIGTGARQAAAALEEKVRAKHGISAEDAKQQLLSRERIRNST